MKIRLFYISKKKSRLIFNTSFSKNIILPNH